MKNAVEDKLNYDHDQEIAYFEKKLDLTTWSNYNEKVVAFKAKIQSYEELLRKSEEDYNALLLSDKFITQDYRLTID